MINDGNILKGLLKKLLDNRLNKLENKTMNEMNDISIINNLVLKGNKMLSKMCINLRDSHNSNRSKIISKIKNKKLNALSVDKKERKTKNKKLAEKVKKINRVSIRNRYKTIDANNLKIKKNKIKMKDTSFNSSIDFEKYESRKESLLSNNKLPRISNKKDNPHISNLKTKSKNLTECNSYIFKNIKDKKIVNLKKELSKEKINDKKELIINTDKKIKKNNFKNSINVNFIQNKFIDSFIKEVDFKDDPLLIDLYNTKYNNITEIFFKDSNNINIILSISSYLDIITCYNFLSTNKFLIKNTLTVLLAKKYDFLLKINNINLEEIKKRNNILNESGIPPPFIPSNATIKALNFLNEDSYNKIFTINELDNSFIDIIDIYKIFFILIDFKEISLIENKNIFWKKASEYILVSNEGKLGNFFKDKIKLFNFSQNNIYKIKKIIYGKENKIKPMYIKNINDTTGLICFLIQDALEYCGAIINIKKNKVNFLISNSEFYNKIVTRINLYIKIIKNL